MSDKVILQSTQLQNPKSLKDCASLFSFKKVKATVSETISYADESTQNRDHFVNLVDKYGLTKGMQLFTTHTSQYNLLTNLSGGHSPFGSG